MDLKAKQALMGWHLPYLGHNLSMIIAVIGGIVVICLLVWLVIGWQRAATKRQRANSIAPPACKACGYTPCQCATLTQARAQAQSAHQQALEARVRTAEAETQRLTSVVISLESEINGLKSAVAALNRKAGEAATQTELKATSLLVGSLHSQADEALAQAAPAVKALRTARKARQELATANDRLDGVDLFHGQLRPAVEEIIKGQEAQRVELETLRQAWQPAP